MLAFLIQGLSLGFTAGATPGPLQTFMIQSSVKYGWHRALICIVSPLISDIPFVFLTLFVLRQFPSQIIQGVQIFGGAFVLFLAYTTARSLRAGVTINADGVLPDISLRALLGRTILLNWLSPGPYIFWASVNGPLLISAVNQSVLHGVAFLVGFYGAFLSILAAWIIAFDRLGRIDARITQAILWLTVGGLVIFGLGLIISGLGIGG